VKKCFIFEIEFMFRIIFRSLSCWVLVCSCSLLKAQLSGTFSIPGTYSTIAAALADINAQGVNGPLTIQIQAAHTETAPVGGLVLTATGTSINPIIFRKVGVGANPLVTAYSGGTGIPSSAVQDGIWRFVGSDFVTVDGVDLVDLNSTNPATMEYGYGFFKVNPFNGCHNNTIQNCVITLRTINNANGTGPAVEGSRGINIVNSLANFQTSNLTPASLDGSNSNNKIYSNVISNCNVGISIIGYVAPNPFTFADRGNEIGSLIAATGNTIVNFGGAVGATNAAAGIRTLAQYDLLVSNNIVNNNTGSNVNHSFALRGIFVNTAVSANTSIFGNTVTLQSGATNQPASAIENVSGATAFNNTVAIQSNVVTNCANNFNTSGSFFGIYNNAASSSNLILADNTFSNVNTQSSTGSNYLIYNTGAIAGLFTCTNNLVASCSNTSTSSGSFFGLFNSAAITGDLLLSANVFTNQNCNAVTGAMFLIYNTGAVQGQITMTANLLSDINTNVTGSGAFHGIYNNAAPSPTLSVSNNTLSAINLNSNSGASHLLYNRGTLPNMFSLIEFQNNLITNSTFSSTGNGAFYHLWNNGVSSSTTNISNNTINDNDWYTQTSLRYVIANWGPANETFLLNNIISNCTGTTNTTGQLHLIYNNNNTSTSGLNLIVANNTLTQNLFSATSGDNYFIHSSGVTTNTYSLIEIRDNAVTNCTTNVTGSSVFYTVYNNIASATTLVVSTNTLAGNTNVQNSGATYYFYNRGQANSFFPSVTFTNNWIADNIHAPSGSGALFGILNVGTPTSSFTNLFIAANGFSNCVSSGSTSAITLINNTAIVTTSILIEDNLISAFANSLTTTGAFNAILNSGGAPGGNLAIVSNTITGLISNATSGSRSFISNTGAVTNSIYIASNVISANTHSASTSGAIFYIYNNSGSAISLEIFDNALSNNASFAQNGATYLIYNSSIIANTYSLVSISANSISDFTTSSTSGIFYGISNNLNTTFSLSVQNNTISNIWIGGNTNTKYLIHNNAPCNGNVNIVSNQILNASLPFTTTGSLFSIVNTAAVAGNLTVLSNTISDFNVAATTATMFTLYNTGTIQNTINASDNFISAVNYSATGNGAYMGIYNNAASSAVLLMSNNSISSLTLNVTNGQTQLLYNRGASTNTIQEISVFGNLVSNILHSATNGSLFGVFNSGVSSASLNISTNTITGVVASNSASARSFIINTGSVSVLAEISSNVISNFSAANNATGQHFGINNSGNSSGIINIQNNRISDFTITATTGNYAAIFNAGISVSTLSILNNTIAALYNSINGTGFFAAISNSSGAGADIIINGNQFEQSVINTINSSSYFIRNSRISGFNSPLIQIENNALDNCILNSVTGSIYGIFNEDVNASFTKIDVNTFGNSVLTSSIGQVFLLQNSATNTTTSLNNNLISNFTVNILSTGTISAIQNSGQSSTLSVSGNSFVNSFVDGGFSSVRLIENVGVVNGRAFLNDNYVDGLENRISGSPDHRNILNSGIINGSIEMSRNTFTNNSTAAIAGNVFLIQNSESISDSIIISNNIFSQAWSNTQTSYSGELSAIKNSGGAVTTILKVNANLFRDFDFNGTNGVGPFYFINNSNHNSEAEISGNSWNNLNLKHNASQYLIYNSSVQNSLAVNNNSIVGTFNRTGAAGSMYLYLSSPAGAGSATQTIADNVFSGITASLQGNGSFYGIFSVDSASVKTISNNIISGTNYNGAGYFYGISADYLGNANSSIASSINNNTLTNIFWNGSFYGIEILPNSNNALAANIYLNSINSVTTNASQFGVYGSIFRGGNTPMNFYQNTIAGIENTSSSGIIRGIDAINSASISLYNNVIGNLAAANSNVVDAICGIKLSGTGPAQVFYNTIYLNALSTGTNFGSAAVFNLGSSTLDLRNNILINLSSATGAAKTAALKLSGVALTNYLPTSNNNIFYCGVPSTSRVLFTNASVSFSTLASFQTYAGPRELLSFSENTTFISNLTGSANFLRVNPSVSSLSESGGLNIAPILNDVDSQIRFGNLGYSGTGTNPDIGADEYEQNLTPCVSAAAGTISLASASVICEGETAHLYSTGFSADGNILHQWRTASTPGGPYANFSNGSGINLTALTTGTLAPGNHYFVLTTTCTSGSLVSVSNEVTVTVNPLPGALANASPSVFCAGASLNLSATAASGSSFQWSGPNSFSASVQNPILSNVSNFASGIYTLNTSLLNCTSEATVAVQVNMVPPNFSISPQSSSICIGASQILNASIPITSPTLNFGLQISQNASNTYPAPYSMYYGGQKMQILILASELNAAGFTMGTPITGIQFPVVSLGSAWGSAVQDCQNFRVSMKATALSSLSSFENNLTTVSAATSFTPIVGYTNTHNFVNPFVWDGASNIVLETVFSNAIIGSAATSVIQNFSSTGFQSTLVYRADNQNFSTIANATTTNVNVGFVRPDFRLIGQSVGNYSWSPSVSLNTSLGASVIATPTISSIFNVTLSNGQCESMSTASIEVFTVPNVSISASSKTLCVGNTATLFASGATTYSWSNGAVGFSIAVSPSINTTYTLTGSNAVCPNANDTISVISLPALVLNVTATPSVICEGSSSTITAIGAQNYLWSNNISADNIIVSPSVTTSYSVLGTSGAGCSATKTYTLRVNPTPVVSLAASKDTICSGESLSLQAMGASTYTWLNVISNSSTITVSPSVTTVYQVTGRNLFNCRDTASVLVQVDICSSIDQQIKGSISFLLFPNPTNGILNFLFEETGTKSIQVLNNIGQILGNFKVDLIDFKIDIGNLAKGIYQIRVSDGNETCYRKIVLE